MTRVILAEDHELVRTGIRLMLEGAGGYEVVGEAPDGREALALVRRTGPDLAILDVQMPRLNGIETARQIRATAPATRVLILSMHGEQQYVREALHAGANGYVVKGAAFKELLAAIEAVMAGRTYLSETLPMRPDVTELKRMMRQEPATELSRLTAREREILQLIAEGNSGTEIARDLGISPRTVESHRERIMSKLDLHSIADLTRFAIRNGVCSAER